MLFPHIVLLQMVFFLALYITNFAVMVLIFLTRPSPQKEGEHLIGLWEQEFPGSGLTWLRVGRKAAQEGNVMTFDRRYAELQVFWCRRNKLEYNDDS